MLEIIIPLLHKCRLFLYFLHLFFKPIDQFFIYKLQYSRSLEELFLPLYKKQSNFLYFKFSLFLNFSNFDALEFSTFKFFLRKFLPQNPSLLLSSRTSTHRLSNMCVCVYVCNCRKDFPPIVPISIRAINIDATPLCTTTMNNRLGNHFSRGREKIKEADGEDARGGYEELRLSTRRLGNLGEFLEMRARHCRHSLFQFLPLLSLLLPPPLLRA